MMSSLFSELQMLQVPDHVARHLPRLFLARWLPLAERLGHQVQAVVVYEVVGHLLGLGILSHYEVALHEQVHAGLLVDHAQIVHVLLRGHVLHGEL